MDVREKLVELIEKASYECDEGTRDLWDMRQVADGIADFLIARGVTVQEWISVKDRLPEDRQWVLGWCGCGRIYHDILHFATCLENISCDFEGSKCSGFYDHDSEWGYYEVTDITHWMPLPQPPKGE
jgi:hypothetical protein